ncbi:PAS domain-containing protein, partial [bacterium]|nr:PAS domain-containing protein [bacterium]
MDTVLKDFLVNNSLEGIVVADMEGTILQCNETAHRMLGYQVSDLEGQFIGFIFPPQSVSHLLLNLLHLARESGGFEGDILLQDSMGDSVMVRMIAQAWPEENPSRLLLRFLDWRETHQVLTQMRESSQMASLGTLTRSLSHEILNPMSVIGSYTRRLLDSLQPDSREEEWARQVMGEVEKLESMVETISNFLHLPSPSFEKYPLDDLLKNSLDGIRKNAEKLGIRIIGEKSRKLPNIFVDPDLLKKALSAILLNAVSRMPKGGELTLDLSFKDDHCQISVEDTGPTLDAWQMEEDLSPIHLIGAHRTHLNLAIAKRIVDEH